MAAYHRTLYVMCHDWQNLAMAQVQRVSGLPLEVWCCGMLVTLGGDDDRQANLQR